MRWLLQIATVSTLVPTQHPLTQNVDCVAVSMRQLTIWSLTVLNWLNLNISVQCHNKAAAHMHWTICKEFGIEVKERWYEHEPKTVIENDSVTFLWDMAIHTDRTIAANRPDISKEQEG